MKRNFEFFEINVRAWTFFLSKVTLALLEIEIDFKVLNTIDELVFFCKLPTEMDFMAIAQTDYYVDYFWYSDYLFTHEIYFSTFAAVREDKNGKKRFYVAIRAVSLKSSSLNFRLDLSVTISGKKKPEEKRLPTINIENHDGKNFEYLKTYDYVPAEEVKIVPRNIQLESYSEEEFETKVFLNVLSTISTYNFSGHVEDFGWYRNDSPKQTTSKGKRY